MAYKLSAYCLIVLSICCCSYGGENELSLSVDYSEHIVVQIKPNKESDLELLKKLETSFKLDFWNDPLKSLRPVLTDLSPSQRQVLTRLNESNIEYEIISNSLQRMIDEQNEEIEIQRYLYANVFDYDGAYHKYEEIVAQFNDIAKDTRFSNIVKTSSIGTTFENRSIIAITIHNGTDKKKEIILECGIHAREWIATAACLWIVNDLLNNAANKARLDKFTFVVVPVLNADGYEYTWTTDRKWRKTRSLSTKSSTCRGADPNRNWDSEFCKSGASSDPCEETYCGDYAFHEKESKAMADFIAQKKGNIAAYFAFHSFSQLWMYPWGYTTKQPPNSDRLHKLSKDAVTAIKATNGLVFDYGTIANTIYEASGSSVDWAYDKAGVELAFAIELRDTGKYGFILPANQIKAASTETWNGIKAVIDQI